MSNYNATNSSMTCTLRSHLICPRSRVLSSRKDSREKITIRVSWRLSPSNSPISTIMLSCRRSNARLPKPLFSTCSRMLFLVSSKNLMEKSVPGTSIASQNSSLAIVGGRGGRGGGGRVWLWWLNGWREFGERERRVWKKGCFNFVNRWFLLLLLNLERKLKIVYFPCWKKHRTNCLLHLTSDSINRNCECCPYLFSYSFIQSYFCSFSSQTFDRIIIEISFPNP